MKILYEGRQDKLNKVLQFECHNCGCIWEADKNEYICGYTENTMDCPYCKTRTYGYKKVNTSAVDDVVELMNIIKKYKPKQEIILIDRKETYYVKLGKTNIYVGVDGEIVIERD